MSNHDCIYSSCGERETCGSNVVNYVILFFDGRDLRGTTVDSIYNPGFDHIRCIQRSSFPTFQWNGLFFFSYPIRLTEKWNNS